MIARQRYVVANWKMNGSLPLLSECNAALHDTRTAKQFPELILCPPHPLLQATKAASAGRYAVGAQDCHWQQQGAFTGEVSPGLLHELGATHVLIGHSERRTLMGETNEYVADKVLAAWDAGLVPILCIGENLAEYQAKETYAVLSTQLFECLPKSAPTQELMIAYEPMWAIGSGLTPTLQEIQDCHDHIRTYLSAYWSIERADALPVLYGGSVNPENTSEIINLTDVDGVLVGGASLKPDSLLAITLAAAE